MENRNDIIDRNFRKMDTKEKAETLNNLMNLFMKSLTDDRLDSQNSTFNDNKELYVMYIEEWKQQLQKNFNLCGRQNEAVNYFKQKGIHKQLKTMGETGEDLYSFSYFQEKMEHNEYITCMIQFYHMGQILIASGGEDFLIKVWNPFTGEKKITFAGHTHWINCLLSVQTAARNLIVSGCNDRTIRIWDIGSKSCVGTLKGHTEGINCLLSVQTDERNLIASGSYDKTIKIWDVDNKECVANLEGHSERITRLIKIKNEERNSFASASYDKTIRLWNVDSKECYAVLEGNTENVECLINIDSDLENLIASGDRNSTLKIWNVDSRQCVSTFDEYPDSLNCLLNTRTARNNYIISGSFYSSIRLWDLEKKEYAGDLWGHNGIVQSLINIKSYSEPYLIASCGWDKTVRIWNVDYKYCVATYEGHTDSINCILNIQTRGTNLIASAGSDKIIKLYDLNTNECLNDQQYNINEMLMFEHKDSLFIVLTFQTKFIHVWKYSLNTFFFYAKLQGHTDSALYLRNIKTNEGNLILSAGNDYTFRIWDVETGDCKGVLNVNSSILYSSIVFKTESQNLLACSCSNGIVQLWDVDRRECFGVLEGHKHNDVRLLKHFSNEGRNYLASGSYEITKIWDLDTRQCLVNLEGEFDSLTFIGRNLITCYLCDNIPRLQVWNLECGSFLRELLINKPDVHGIVKIIHVPFEGRNLFAIGRKDNTLILLDFETGESKSMLMNDRIDSLQHSAFRNKNFIICCLLKSVKIIDVKSFRCVSEIFRNSEILIKAFCPSELVEGKLLLVSKWKYNIVRITLLSFSRAIKTVKGRKNFVCSGPLFSS